MMQVRSNKFYHFYSRIIAKWSQERVVLPEAKSNVLQGPKVTLRTITSLKYWGTSKICRPPYWKNLIAQSTPRNILPMYHMCILHFASNQTNRLLWARAPRHLPTIRSVATLPANTLPHHVRSKTNNSKQLLFIHSRNRLWLSILPQPSSLSISLP